jgi:glycosyltransferase involved in cell wall biosynthesis
LNHSVLEMHKMIVMVGAFPPPVHGMAAVNAAVLDRLKDIGRKPLVLNLAASTLDRSLFSRLNRIPRVMSGILQLSFQPSLRGSALYMSVSGGWGQIYELMFLAVAHLHGMRVFLHHHSFAYLDHPNFVTRILIRVAGNQATHITLSPGMAKHLCVAYPGVKGVASVSNAIFLLGDSSEPAVERTCLNTLGFLGNISQEKGIYEFLDVCAALQAQGIQLNAKLAGPFQDAIVEKAILQKLTSLPSVEYLGPLYGADKEAFLASIDLLLFPTRYINEAEPLTIHEAMAAGVPVIAYGRGAIPEIVSETCGLVVPVDEDFVDASVKQIEAWLVAPQAFHAASVAAAERFEVLQQENLQRWEKLKAQIMGGVPVAAGLEQTERKSL